MNPQTLKRLIPLALILGLMALAWSLGLQDILSLEAIQAQRATLLVQLEAHPILSALAYIGIYAAIVALSLPVATVLTLLGGFLFGQWVGTLLIVLGATCGATAVFLVARSALGQTLREKAGPLYQRVSKNMQQNAISYMLFMRLVPLFPFVLVNIVPALFNVRIGTYILTTAVGIIPGSFVYANLGRELGQISSLRDLASPQTLAAFALLGAFALIPMLYKKFFGRNEKNEYSK